MAEEIKLRQLEQKTREAEWRKVKDLAKGVKYVMEKQEE